MKTFNMGWVCEFYLFFSLFWPKFCVQLDLTSASPMIIVLLSSSWSITVIIIMKTLLSPTTMMHLSPCYVDISSLYWILYKSSEPKVIFTAQLIKRGKTDDMFAKLLFFFYQKKENRYQGRAVFLCSIIRHFL